MTSWKKTIATPFKKARTFLTNNQTTTTTRDHHNNKKSQTEQEERRVMDLQGEVMACGYEDVQVMWSILDRTKSNTVDNNNNNNNNNNIVTSST